MAVARAGLGLLLGGVELVVGFLDVRVVDVLLLLLEGLCGGDLLGGGLGAGGEEFFRAPRVALVYCMRPLGWMWSGWPTMQVEVSEVSRMLQLSMKMRSPLQT
ncbi:hypothetical protein RBB78_17385 [Tunturiibacter empetritectus]|uniref:hypothetical protein n=1 Tax=Tunturiibacter empetritectus TaxID=3069691 RepID=UPI003D9B9DC5